MKPRVFILDMDGSLADSTNALKWVDPRHPDFERIDFAEFAQAARLSPAYPWALALVDYLAQTGVKMVVVTARSEAARGVTEEWLHRHGVVFTEIRMRPPEHSLTSDSDLKRMLFQSVQRDYEVVGAIDDNPHVIKVLRELGIAVFVSPTWPHPVGAAEMDWEEAAANA